MNTQLNESELLAPAGNFETALAAFSAGADAVYCGLSEFSARAFADNLTLDDLRNLVRFAHASDRRKVYVTFNTVIDEENFEDAIERLARLDEIRPDALIVQDLGVARICRKHFPNLELHASTQLVAHNLEGVLALGELGFRRVVLARELSLEEIASIAKRCGGIELEVFVHGALCYSLSGLCLFGAMEKGRSGNRGKCPYCCRQSFTSLYPFSMKDLRLGEDVRKLAEAGVASLKIEGRMKSPLYVSSVTRYYRQILDARSEAKGQRSDGGRSRVSVSDLETVFSRRTTELYLNGKPSESVIDAESLGHLGAEIGVVKRITKDREGLSWLRFHTARALEKHDGLQFEAMSEGRHVGLGIVEMRQAISRRPVFEVNAGTDVEVLLPGGISNAEAQRRGVGTGGPDLSTILKPGMKIYCSMSNAVKRMFPTPSFRPSDYPGGTEIDVEVTLEKDGIVASAHAAGMPRPHVLETRVEATLAAAKNPEKTLEGVRKAFSKLGDTDYRLGKLTLNDPDKLFAPMNVLNDLRRDLVERLDAWREKARCEKLEEAKGEVERSATDGSPRQIRTIKVRAGQKVAAGEWDEVIVAINAETTSESLSTFNHQPPTSNLRLALPVYTAEPDFNRLRTTVKRFLREGYEKWEAGDLATLRMLKALGVKDITADWTLYAFNSHALAALSELGVKRFVASPENTRENLQYLSESGFDVEFLSQQSTPLFISLTKPEVEDGEWKMENGEWKMENGKWRMEDGEWKMENGKWRMENGKDDGDLVGFRRDGLWVTTKSVPRTFDVPSDVSIRFDISWDF